MNITKAERLRLLARMFTRPVFASLAKTGDWEHALAFLAGYGVLQAGPTQTVGDLFESAWVQLKKHYRNEYVYKAELANRLIFGRHSPRTAALHVEMPVGRSIVDLAVFNGTSTAYEIKTEFDSARRLQTQTSDYLKVFDKVFVVSHPSMAASFCEAVDWRVGVLCLNQRGSLTVIKDAHSNAEQLDPGTVFRCLHRAEYLEAAREATGQEMIYPNGLIAEKCEAIFSSFTPAQRHAVFVNSLRRRRTEVKIAGFVSELPSSLRVAGYATPLSGRQMETALSTLAKEASVVIA
jgi:hypothetical protein